MVRVFFKTGRKSVFRRFCFIRMFACRRIGQHDEGDPVIEHFDYSTMRQPDILGHRKCDGKNENKGVNEEIYGKNICEFKNMVQREEEEFVVLLKNRRNK